MAISKRARSWIRFSLRDLVVARSLSGLGSTHWSACAYHCQQSAEKCMKGYMVQHAIQFPKTHDLRKLIQTISTYNPILAQKLKTAKRLSKYAIEYRYPDAANRPMTKQKAQSAVRLAEKVFEVITSEFNKEK